MRKKIIKAILSLILLPSFFIFIIPYIVSHPSGQKQFFKFISALSNEKVDAKSVDLNWLGPQKINGLHFQSHLVDVFVDELQTDDSLFKWIFDGFVFSHIKIYKPEGVIRTGAKKPTSSKLPAYSFDLLSANLQVQTPGSNFKLNPVDLSVDLKQGYKIEGKGNLSVGLESGNFTFSFKSLEGLVDELTFTSEFLPTSAIENLPLEIAQLNIPKLLGDKLQGSLLFNRSKKAFSLDLKTPKGFIKYPESKSNNLIAELKQPEGSIKVAAKDLTLNFENLMYSSFSGNVSIPSLEFQKNQLKNLSSTISFSKDDLIEVNAEFEIVSEDYFAKVVSKGSLKKDLKEVDLTFSTPQLRINQSLFQNLKDPKITNFKSKYQNAKWSATAEIFSEFDLGKPDNILCSIESSPAFSPLELPNLVVVKIDSKLLKTSLDLNLKEPISTHSSTYFTIEVPQSFAKKISPQFDPEKQITINGMLDKGASLDKITGIFSVPQIKFIASDHPILISFQKGNFELSPKSLIGSLYLNGAVDKGSFALDVTRENFKTFESKIRLVNLPVSTLDLFSNLDKTAKNFIGKTINGNAYFSSKNNFQGISLNLTTDQGSIKLSGEMQDKFFQITKPSKLSFNFKSIEENTWFKQHDLFIVSEPKLSLDIQELLIPTNLNFDEMVINSKFEITDLKFFSEHEIASLDQLSGECKKKANETLQAFLSSDAKIGKIDGKAVIEKITFKPISSIFSSILGVIELELKNVPSIFLKAASAPFINEKFSSILSDRSNLFFKFDTKQYPKRLSLNVDSKDLQLNAEGVIEGSDFILKKPLKVTLDPNEGFKSLFYDYTGIHFIDSRTPLEFEIAPKGFLLPLENVKLENLQIANSELNLGQIDVRNDGTMSLTDTFFKKKLGNQIRLWFQPIEFRIVNGFATFNRFDVLIMPNMQVAFWGKIDLKKQYVDCTLGLTAQSLKNTLGMSDLPKDFVLTVPVRGKFGEVKVDKGQALTKIATLLASKQNFSGQFGGFLDLMNQMMNDQGKIPKPKKPFPWDGSLSFDLKTKKDFLLKFKQNHQEKELLSYSISLDPIIHMIQEQINLLNEPTEESSDSLVDGPEHVD